MRDFIFPLSFIIYFSLGWIAPAIGGGAEDALRALARLDVEDQQTFSVDDDRFEVVGDMLMLKEGMVLDHEDESEVTVSITATDVGGLSATESFTLSVRDMYDGPVAIDDVAQAHFETVGTGSAQELWDDDFSGNWTSRWPLKWVNHLDKTSTFELGGETWVRVHYPEGEERKGFKLRSDHFEGRDSVYFEYDLRFASDFDWVLGGKLPGIYGGKITAGEVPNGEDGFLVRFMWKADGKGSAYVYHPEQSRKWGDHIRLDDFWFKKGVVQTLGLELELNTPGKHDGSIRAWLDGVLVVEKTNMRFRDVSNLQIEGINFDTFFGGNTDDWAPSKDEHIDFGDFKFYAGPPWERSKALLKRHYH